MRVIGALVLALAMSAPALAQDKDPRFPAAGTVVRTATVFWIRDASRTSIILLAAGADVTVIARIDPWYKIVFHTPQGDQMGNMAPHDIRFDPNAVQTGDVSSSGAVSERGFAEGRAFGFPQQAPNDITRVFGDALVREEVFLKPVRWLQFAGGLDLRASSHDQVDDEWRLDLDDRGILRPRLALRRLTLTLNTAHVQLDLGKQIIRWGMADILSPTDRFAPRDYLNVIDNEVLPVTGARAAVHGGSETVEVVWQPRMTPSRLPLINQRWAVVPPEAAGFGLEDNGAVFPSQSQQGVRWSHVGRFEMGLSYFDGFNHLPDVTPSVDPERGVISLTRTYSALRTYGGEVIVPTRALTLKGEAAYFTSPTSTSEEYVLFVVEAERQVGEWIFDGGYAGEVVTKAREGFLFSAERGMAHSIIGRAAYTVDPARTVAVEGAARQDGRGVYVKGEFSEAFGQHWRLTLTGVGISGKDDDFLGQYRHNSHASATLRFSF